MTEVNPVPYIDLPDVREIFADNVRMMSFNDNVLRIEFTVTRTDDLKQPNAAPTAHAYPAARLALTATAAFQMAGHLTRMLDSLEKQGLMKRTATGPISLVEPPTTPKH